MNNHHHYSQHRKDAISRVLQEIETAESEMNPKANQSFARADRYALQAVELTMLPSGKARRRYVERFYTYNFSASAKIGEGLADKDGIVKAWARGNGELGFWFEIRHSGSIDKAKDHRRRAHSGRLHRHFWAMISVASATAQEVRTLDDIAAEAFASSATGRVNVDLELIGITSQLLGASEIREEIGNEPRGDSPEIQQLRMVWKRQIDELDTKVIQPVLNRMAALCEYRDRLLAVHIQSATVDRLSRSVGTDEKLAKLVGQSGHDVDGTSQIEASTSDLHEAAIARSAALAEVRGDYLTALMLTTAPLE